jgi:hypothetical protein
MVCILAGYQAIEIHILKGSSSADVQRLAIIQCKQAFAEVVIRAVHFKCFRTGRKFMVDACHQLLRCAGCDLANRLVRMATSLKQQDPLYMGNEEMKDSTGCIAEVMSAWQSIMTMTSLEYGRTYVSDAFEEEMMKVIESFLSTHWSHKG